MIDGSFEGRELRKQFESKSLNVESEIEDVMEDQVERVLTDSVMMAPVDTGRLKNSLGKRKVHSMEYEVGSDVEYAPDVELGSMNQTPQPYLRPALEKNKESIKNAIADAIRRGMK